MTEQLLIIGVDPGTTVGFAAIDLNGNIIKLFSQKEISLSSLIEKIIVLGKPVLVGCDVTPAPTFVEKFATKIGAKLIDPDMDLTITEKKSLVKDFEEKIQNNHQRDALSAALYAYKIIKPLLKKIDEVLKKEKKQHLEKEVKELAIKKEIAIKTAIDIIEKPEEPEIKIIKKAIEKRIFSEKDFLELYDRLKKTEKEIKLLKNQNQKLKKEQQENENKINFLLKKTPQIISPELKQKLSFKEKRIEFLTIDIEKQKLELKRLQEEIKKLNQFISDLNSNILIKKLDNLGMNEYQEKNKKLNIKQNDILLVEDLDICSQKVIDELKDKNIVLFYKKASRKTKQTLPFILLDTKDIKLKENKLFAAISKKEFQEVQGKHNLLNKIVKEYQEKRTKD